MKKKIQIKSFYGGILFEFTKEKNTLKETVREAVRLKIDLTDAYLANSDLTKINLAGANLFHADLSNSNLGGCDLHGANLERANLCNANISFADIRNANLTGASVTNADFYNSNLTGAIMMNCDLAFADFSNAVVSLKALESARLFHTDLHDTRFLKDERPDLEHFKPMFWIVPEEGSFIAWKKGANRSLIKLSIPSEAKRTSNIRNRICRAEFATILAIYDGMGNEIESTASKYNPKFEYKRGIIRPDKYDDDWTIDCSHGIHFFLTKEEALNYY